MDSKTLRSSAPAALRCLIGIVAMVGTALIALPSSAGAATSSSSVTYSAQVTVPAPPASNFSGASGGGDGWGVGLTSTQVFNVFHHNSILQVNCHNQSDASDCWTGPKTIQDGSANDFATSGQPALWVDQATGFLYVYATRTIDSTGGVVCIDTTADASVADPFCGFTALTAGGDAPLDGSGISGVSDGVMVGSKWYAFNYVNSATPSGGQDQLLCFDTTTLDACTGQPLAVDYGGGSVSDNGGFPTPAVAAVASQVIIPITTGAGDMVACYDAGAGATCSGSWPISAPAGYPAAQGAPFPLLDANGTTIGTCLPVSPIPCFDMTGASVTTPTNLPNAVAIAGGSDGWNGPAVTIGARVYVPDGNVGSGVVECFDYATGDVCSGFSGGLAFANLSYLYSVTQDPLRPTCLWVNADGGTSQIQNFDAFTGGACGSGPVRILASSFVANSVSCLPAQWSSLQVTDPAASTYTSGTIDFQDSDGQPIAGVSTHNLDANGSTSLTDLQLTTQQALPQFLITLTGFTGTLSSVTVKFTWSGTYDPSCVTGNVTAQPSAYHLGGSDGGVYAPPPASFDGSVPGLTLGAKVGDVVGIAATPDGLGYWIVGADGGIFAFGDAPYDGSLPGSGVHVSNIVGMAVTPDGGGYWLVGADGGIFAFGDAPYDGSLPGLGVHVGNIVGIAANSGGGYWLVGSDGGTFAFGGAPFNGSLPGLGVHVGNIVGIAAQPGGSGFWLVGSDGGIFAFGAPYDGSLPGLGAHVGNIVGIAATPTGGGYWLAGSDGGVFAFGDAPYDGSLPGLGIIVNDIVGIAT